MNEKRIAIILQDKCQKKRCNFECYNFCPKVRNGVECVISKNEKAVISEDLCSGCGICVKKCPFNAIRIIGLKSELKNKLIHKYGENSFRIFKLPSVKIGKVIGILGQNGIGKTTTIEILSGKIVPNFGDYKNGGSEKKVLDYFKSSEMYEYFKLLYEKKLKIAIKPQYVNELIDFEGLYVIDIFNKLEVEKSLEYEKIIEELELKDLMLKKIGSISGGELQKIYIALTLLKDADVYFFDEPSSFLDIFQRIKISKIIKKLSEKKQVIVVEHDLAILDFLTDDIYIVYGEEGAYGIFSSVKKSRVAINSYLEGYIKEENVRFRDKPITFSCRSFMNDEYSNVINFPNLKKKLDSFTLNIDKGSIKIGKSIGVLGPNSVGKTTFMKILSGDLKPDEGIIEYRYDISYKPQYLFSDYDGTVKNFLNKYCGEALDSKSFKMDVVIPLKIGNIENKTFKNLSGGELQRVFIAKTLSEKADIYIFDEPTAYLDSDQRINVANIIRKNMEKNKKSGIVVDHDMYFLDMVSDSVIVFNGIPGKEGFSEGPLNIKEGMDKFLKCLGVTFRRDKDSLRPRINKEGSKLDKEQKEENNFYYF